MFAPKILVVDDSRTVRTVVANTLQQVGYEVISAPDGLACMKLVEQTIPALAILDIQMPHLDGYGVCQEFQKLGEPFSSIPIIFLTTIDSNALDLLAEELGGYLQKPVHPRAV